MTAKTDQDIPEPDEAELPQADVVEEPEEEPTLSPEELLKNERDEHYENWRRSQADLQNLRRRQGQVIEASVKRARRELFAELLIVLDYLDMALLAECTTDEAKNLHMGVSLTRDQMLGVLERFEVKPIEEHKAFDPTVHQAPSRVEDDEKEEGAILEVVRKGYWIGDQVLRHAQVHVVGVEEPAPEPDEAEEPAEEHADDSQAEEA